MPRKYIDFTPNLPASPADPTAHKPVISSHGMRGQWPTRLIIISVIVAAAGYVWFV